MSVALKKTAIQKTRIPESNLFFIRELHDRHFDPTWHAHSEYQLFLVVEGTGTKFVGNTVKPYESGDMTFLAPNIPHLWRSDECYFDPHGDQVSRGLVIYFNGSAFSQFLEKEEFAQLKSLLEKVKRGMEIYGKTARRTAKLMHELLHLHGMERVIQLFKIFHILIKTKEFGLLHDDVVSYKLKEVETNRINLVYNYVAKHFKYKVTLEEVAALLNMTPTSFSRYFTTKTSKSFSYFLTELRIRNACRLLSTEEAKNIAQICYESGFNTLSNFNKQFKTFIGMTPTEYRQKFLTL